jgi:hypothetical protein
MGIYQRAGLNSTKTQIKHTAQTQNKILKRQSKKNMKG